MENFLEVGPLEQFLAEHPNSLVFAALASRYIEQGNLEKALKLAEEGVETHPQYAYGHFVLGLCYYQMNNFAKAKTHLEIATAYDEKNPRAWKLLGEINEKLDLPLLAEECFGKYYLTDSFGTDAARKFLKNEMLQMEDFDDQETAPEFVEAPEGAGGESSGKTTGGTEIAAELDKLFEEEENEDFLEKTAEKVDEVFRETVGEEETAEESFAPELNESPEAGAETEAPEQPDDDFSDAMDRMFDEFSDEQSAPAEPDLDAEKPATPEEPAAEENSDLPPAEIAPEEPAEITPSGEEGEDLLDFSSVVEDIISDRDEETPETAPPEPSSQTTMTIVREDESQADQVPVEPEESSPKEEDAGDSAGQTDAPRFGRPPILSPTLGEIYVAQGRYQEALEVFEQLLEKDPQNQRFQRKIADIKMIINRQSS